MLEIGTKSKDMGQARHDSAQLDFGPPRATSTSERKKNSVIRRERTKAIYREWLLSEHIPFPLLFYPAIILLKENEAIILTAVIIINII
jgi:hypothetical protein